MTVFGVHAGLQNTSMAALRSFWHRVEALGFGWISVWDHFYSATLTDGAECLEAVATHAALACDMTRVRCGSLVYSIGYRHPAVLANAIATIDHLSAGRADLGIGRGLERDRVPRLRHSVPAGEGAHGSARGSGAVHPQLVAARVTTFRGGW